jgi:hypothetical protein
MLLYAALGLKLESNSSGFSPVRHESWCQRLTCYFITWLAFQTTHLVTNSPYSDSPAFGHVDAASNDGNVVVRRRLSNIQLGDGDFSHRCRSKLLESSLDTSSHAAGKMSLGAWLKLGLAYMPSSVLDGFATTYQFHQSGHPLQSICRRSSASG